MDRRTPCGPATGDGHGLARRPIDCRLFGRLVVRRTSAVPSRTPRDRADASGAHRAIGAVRPRCASAARPHARARRAPCHQSRSCGGCCACGRRPRPRQETILLRAQPGQALLQGVDAGTNMVRVSHHNLLCEGPSTMQGGDRRVNRTWVARLHPCSRAAAKRPPARDWPPDHRGTQARARLRASSTSLILKVQTRGGHRRRRVRARRCRAHRSPR